MKFILALDIGISTGWAVRTRSGNIVCGLENLKKSRHDHPGMELINLESLLDKIQYKSQGIDIVVYEEGSFIKGVQATQSLERKKGVMIHWCEVHKIRYCAMNVSTIKKHATGKGNANKEMMKEFAIKKFGDIYPADRDEGGDMADALFTLSAFLNEIEGR